SHGGVSGVAGVRADATGRLGARRCPHQRHRASRAGTWPSVREAHAPRPIVLDVHILVHAVTEGDGPSPTFTFPSPPPVLGRAPANCVGIVSGADDWGLVVSPHILD